MLRTVDCPLWRTCVFVVRSDTFDEISQWSGYGTNIPSTYRCYTKLTIGIKFYAASQYDSSLAFVFQLIEKFKREVTADTVSVAFGQLTSKTNETWHVKTNTVIKSVFYTSSPDLPVIATMYKWLEYAWGISMVCFKCLNSQRVTLNKRRDSVPDAPKSIDVVPSSTEASATVSWKYEGQCATTEFRVEVYNTDGRSLKTMDTINPSIRIDGLPTCVRLLVGVLARNKIGPGIQKNSSTFMIDAVPNAPKMVRTIAVPNVAGVTASWDYDGKCTVADFQVNVYNSGGTSIKSLESGGRSKEISDLPVCVQLVVGILGRNKFGSGPQTNSSVFTVAAVPDLPKSVRAATVPNTPTATVSWKYDGDCPVTGFQVVVQKPDGQALMNVDKSSRSAEFPDLPMCVPLRAGVLARNKVGSGQQRNSTTFTIDSVPNPPKNIQTIVAPKVTSATVLWEYDGICSVADFRINVYNRNGSSLKTLDIEGRSVDIANLPTCVPLHVGVLGRNSFGSGQEIKSLPFTIDTVPSAPKNVRAQTTPNVSSLTVVWEYEDECSTTEFQVSVDKADGSTLTTVNANGLSRLVDDMPFCIPLIAGVVGRNLFGDGPLATSALFSIDAVPGPPKSVRAITVPNVATATIVWDYDNACSTVDYIVNVYKQEGSSLKYLETKGRSAEINDLPMCVALLVGVLGRNRVGSGPQMNSSAFTIPTVPTAPKNVRAVTEPDASGVTVSWDYDGSCPITSFQVSVHNPEGTPLKTLDVTGRKKKITGLPVCVQLLARVLGRNQVGSGPHADSSSFTVNAAPSPPKKVRVNTVTNVASANVTWEYDGPCSINHFRVSIYRTDGSLLKYLDTSSSRTEIVDLPMCVALRIAVEGRNQVGSGQQTNSSEFTIAAAPAAPKNIVIEVQSNSASVTASWEYDGMCSTTDFEVTVQRLVGPSIKSLSTLGRTTVISDLPVCVPLMIGVLSRNQVGPSQQTKSSQFTIDAVPIAPKNVRTIPVPNTASVNVLWDYDGECGITDFQVSVRKPDGSALTTVDTIGRSAEIGSLPMCVDLLVEVRGRNKMGLGPQADSSVFSITAVLTRRHLIRTSFPYGDSVRTIVEPNAASVNVLWEYSGACPTTGFQVSVYKPDGPLIKTLDRSGRNTEITGLPLCEPLKVGVLGRNLVGAGQQTNSPLFTIPAGTKRYFYRKSHLCMYITVSLLNEATRVANFTPRAIGRSKPSPFYRIGKQSLSKNIRPITVPNVPSVTVLWDYDGACATTHFQVSVLKPGESSLMTLDAIGRSVEIKSLPMCVELSVGVVGRNQFGSGPLAESSIFTIAAGELAFIDIWPDVRNLPNSPKSIRINTVPNAANATVTWKYDGACPITGFHVNVYDEDGSSLRSLETMGRSIEIANLPLCEALQIGVIGRNHIGTGSQVKSSAFTIAAGAIQKHDEYRPLVLRSWLFRSEAESVFQGGRLNIVVTQVCKKCIILPSLPKSVRVITVPNVANAIVLWEYDGECLANDFQVTVYQSNEVSIKTLDTVPRSAELTELPLCKPLTVGVLGRNQVGSGPQTKSSEFSIPGAPTVPTAIQVKKANNVPSATVSWEYDGACPATNFQVIVSKPDGSSVESVVRNDRRVEVPGLPMCVPLVARVRARNEVGDSLQANSEEFTIPAAPGLISELTIKTKLNTAVVTVSWGYNNPCDTNKFSVVVYNLAGVELGTWNTSSHNVQIPKLPMNVPLLAGVTGHNEIGSGPQRNSTLFTIPAVPENAMDITVSVLPGQPQANVSWAAPTSDIDSKFTVNLYNGSTPVQSRKTDQHHILFQDVALCVSWTVGIVAENEHGSSPEEFSREFRIPAIPSLPKNVNAATELNAPSATVSWEYDGSCAVAEFSVNVFKSDGTLVKSAKTPDQVTRFVDLPLCVDMYVSVSGSNDVGSGPQTKSPEFSIPAVPVSPTVVRVKTLSNVREVTATWVYNGTCRPTEFDVNVYNPARSSIKSVVTRERRVKISDLPVCVALVIGVLGRNENGPGPQMNSEQFIISSVPAAPQEVQVQKEDNIPTAVVSWGYDSACSATDFEVSVYNRSGASIKSVVTNERRTELPDLPLCTLLFVGVLGRSLVGNGPQSNSSQFNIDAVPSLPKNIQVKTIENVPKATVSWDYDGACAVNEYRVSVYAQDETILMSFTTSARSMEVVDLPMCGALLVGVRGQNQIGLGPEAKSSEFTISGVPKPPEDLQVKTVTSETNAVVSWDYKGECPTSSFQVSAYKEDGTSLGSVSTTGRNVELSDLPLCTSLYVGVVAQNGAGSSPQTKTIPLTIPGVPSLPTKIRITKVENLPDADVSWDYDGLCRTTSFLLQVYNSNGASVKSVNGVGSSAKLVGLPVCERLHVGILGRNEVGNGPQANSSEFILDEVLAPPKSVQVKTVADVPSATVSWDYDGPCSNYSFRVTAYRLDKSSIASVLTGDRSVLLSGLPICEPQFIGVHVHNAIENGPQTDSLQFIIPSAPGEPTAVKVKAEPSVTNATVSWDYTHACVADQFKVILYSPYGAILNTVTTSGRDVNLFNLSVNVPLYVGVLGINAVGTGPEKKSRNFIISHGLTAELRISQPEAKLEVQPANIPLEDSINVTVSTHRGQSFVDVSWVVRMSHNISKFTVNLYNVSSMVQSQTTDHNSTTFWYVDPCQSWTVGVSAQHEDWTSQEWFSKGFRIPAGYLTSLMGTMRQFATEHDDKPCSRLARVIAQGQEDDYSNEGDVGVNATNTVTIYK
ncbi:hypothetical protein CLF_101925 [Clonorchis sinensis]|uniref:Fibronectin type-III domain-containing protein n=1 Tax=Clonorchis sinensis TaxID=79923 RepID=G7Y6W0_CLOSI|nr:hypothetical protein CLF_101925 [Clonorchis sinensis]